MWAGKSHEAIRALHSRALGQFTKLWLEGPGAKLVDEADELMGRAPEIVDPERIRNASQREAYQAWILAGDVPQAAAKLGVPEDRLRESVLDALEDLLRLASERRARTWRGLDLSRLPQNGALSEYLELGRERMPRFRTLPEDQRRLCDHINRQFLVLRIALGLAAPEEARESLGALVHARVRDEGLGGYDRWSKSLGLSRDEFVRLLGDELEPSDALLRRLARALHRPVADLRRRVVLCRETRRNYRAAGDGARIARLRDNLLVRLAR